MSDLPNPTTWRFTDHAWAVFWETLIKLSDEGLVNPDNVQQADADIFYTVLATKMLESCDDIEHAPSLDDAVAIIKITLANEIREELQRIGESN